MRKCDLDGIEPIMTNPNVLLTLMHNTYNTINE